MATYKEIKGVTVQTLDSDPVVNAGSWASGTSVNTARSYLGSAGIKTALVIFGGLEPAYSNKTESWNGSAWTELNELNTARSAMASGGTYTAAFSAGGRISTPDSTAVSEEWNGTSWAEGNDLNLERYSLALGAGSQTAGLALGGNKRFSPSPSPSYTNDTEEYNGTSWTEVTNMPVAVEGQGANGTQTATAVFGGYDGSLISTGILYDGTNWTSTTSLPTAASTFSSSGSQTEGLLFGLAAPGVVSNTLSFDGTAFTELNDLSTARTGGGGPTNAAGTDKSAILAAGFTTTYVAVTEEWSFPPPTSAVLTEGDLFLSGGTGLKGFGKAAGIPSSTWASGGSLNTARRGMGGFGLQTAAVAAAGSTGSTVANSESYNGSSWTEGNDVNTARFDLAAAGTQTAGIIFSGDPYSATTETYDGTSYTEVGDLNTARQKSAGFGAQPSAICAGGEGPPGAQSITEIWNGSSWTETGDMNTARFGLAAALKAPSSNGIVFGGYISNDSALAETWDGTAWTETGDLNTSRYYLAGSGTASSALAFGGSQNPPTVANAEAWNGSSWTETGDLATAREQIAGAGFAATALAFGGGPSVTSATEEFTADATLSTVTVS